MNDYPTISGKTSIRQNNVIKSLPGVAIRLVQAETGESIEFASEKDGAFSTRASKEGRFWWDFPGLSRQYYLEKITFTGKELTLRQLLVDRWSHLNPISIQFAAGAAAISGRIVDVERGQCIRYSVYTIGLRLSDGESLFVKRADECSEDAFHIYSLPPGQYQVVALPIEANSVITQNAGTNSRGVNADDYAIISRTINNPDRATAVLTLETGQTLKGVTPIMLKRETVQSGKRFKSLLGDNAFAAAGN